jgi:hypothetical protein
MNPDSKLLLDEMHRLFAEADRKWDARFTDVDRKWDARFADSSREVTQRLGDFDESFSKRLADIEDSFSKRFAESDLDWERRITDSEIQHSELIIAAEQRQENRLNAVVKATGSLESWRQESEGTVDDLKLKMNKLTKYMDRSFLDNSDVGGVISLGPSTVEQAAASAPADTSAAQPSGHDVLPTTRVDGFGGNFSPIHSPAEGMPSTPTSIVFLNFLFLPMMETPQNSG